MGDIKVKKDLVKIIARMLTLVIFCYSINISAGMISVTAAVDSQNVSCGDSQDSMREDDSEEYVTKEGASEEDIFADAEILSIDAEKNGKEYDGYIFQAAEGCENQVDKIVEDIIDEASDWNLSGDGADENLGVTGAESGACIDIVENSEGLYTAESIEDIEKNIPEEYIEYIEPDYYAYLDYSVSAPNDSYYNYNNYQYNLSVMNVDDVWALGIEGQDLDDSVDMDYDGNSSNDKQVIAILDSGLYMEHSDIDYTRVVSPVNLYPDSTDDSDEIGHGTFIAGMLIAKKNNQQGIAGIGQDFNIQPVKVFSSTGKTKTSVLTSGLNYVMQEKLDFIRTKGESGLNISVVNMSFGTDSYVATLKNAITSAAAAGILLVASAGNEGNTTAQYPAQFCIGVGSTTKSSEVSSFSEIISSDNGTGYENKVWVTAPGSSITSTGYTSSTGYSTGSGTSFSAPEVAALGAICKSIDNDITQSEFKALLKETAVSMTSTYGTTEDGQDMGFGWGIVDFEAAVKSLLGEMEGTVIATIQTKYLNGDASSKASSAIYTVSSDSLGTDIKDTLVLPNADGSYTLNKGQRYIYSVTEPLCETVEGTLAAVNSRSILCEIEKAASYGDIDADGAITAADASMMMLYTVCGDSLCLSKPKVDAIDVDGDGIASTTDVICLLDYMTGRISILPAVKNR